MVLGNLSLFPMGDFLRKAGYSSPLGRYRFLGDMLVLLACEW